MRSTRNFIRKWGHFVKHDPLMKPIIPPKYNFGFIIKNCNEEFLQVLEPWADTCYVDCDYEDYIAKEQPNTAYDLRDRIKPFDNEKNCEILIQIDRSTFTQQDFQIIQQLSEILKEGGEIGIFEIGNLFINVVQMNEYQNDLIKL